jgi:hypothetical protein
VVDPIAEDSSAGAESASVVRPRSQAGARAIAAISSPRPEYRRLRRVGEGASTSSEGASGSNAAPAEESASGVRPRSQAGARAIAAISWPQPEYRRLRRVGEGASASSEGTSGSNAVPAEVRACAPPAKAKGATRREPYQVRYYAVSSVSRLASQRCPLAPGVYCGVWRDIQLLVLGRNLLGSGVSLQGFDTLDLALAHLLPPSRRRAFQYSEEVVI